MCQVNLLVEWMDGNEYQVCQNQYLSVLAEKNDSCCHLEETIHDFLLVGKWHECAGHIYGTLEGKWKSEELSKEAYSYKGFYSSPCSGWNSWVAPLWEMGEDWVVKWACGCSGGIDYYLGEYRKIWSQVKNKMLGKASAHKPLCWPAIHTSGGTHGCIGEAYIVWPTGKIVNFRRTPTEQI